jgi:hypothetical protein
MRFAPLSYERDLVSIRVSWESTVAVSLVVSVESCVRVTCDVVICEVLKAARLLELL